MKGGRKPYETGYRYEAREVKYRRANGFYVKRNHGSHGDFDLLAVNYSSGHVHFVEVKSYIGRRRKFPEAVRRLSGLPEADWLHREIVHYRAARKGAVRVREVEPV